METKIPSLLIMMRDIVDIMESKQVLQEFKQFASLEPNCPRKEVVIHLLSQWIRIECEKNNLLVRTLKKNPKTLNIVLGEVAQSFEKSIFANYANVNSKNSFLNSSHLRLIAPSHQNEDSITKRLCEEFDTLVIDIYTIPIPTNILAVIRSEMRKSGLIERILNFQMAQLRELIVIVQPKHLRFICRYKSLIKDSSVLIDSIAKSNPSWAIEFIRDDALSGYRGKLHKQKWIGFITNTSSIYPFSNTCNNRLS
jgi:hypothetical protein